ncbi:hypothetical protein BaRGS_00012048 [Batillaria attramentaria]|uniref:Cyclase n=1 Tax=Batillaria attramentaria TaxID=370345 RepID=A0ABD0LBF8_9CAEN
MIAAVYILACVTSSFAAVTVIDLTHDLSEDSVFWPGAPPFNFTILNREQRDGFWYEFNYVGTSEHGSTHADAPAHFAKGQWRVHEIPASNLVGPAVMIDVSQKAKSDPDYRLSVDDIQKWEATHGRIPDRAVVLAYFGIDKLYPNPFLVFGTRTPSDPTTFHFPSIHPEAATFLTGQRSVIAVGVDGPSTDYGQSTTFDTHVILGKHNVLGLEGVNNIAKLPPRGATVVIGLIKTKDGSGGPARILGIIDDRAGSGVCEGLIHTDL